MEKSCITGAVLLCLLVCNLWPAAASAGQQNATVTVTDDVEFQAALMQQQVSMCWEGCVEGRVHAAVLVRDLQKVLLYHSRQACVWLSKCPVCWPCGCTPSVESLVAKRLSCSAASASARSCCCCASGPAHRVGR